jgi:hypothetical protein
MLLSIIQNSIPTAVNSFMAVGKNKEDTQENNNNSNISNNNNNNKLGEHEKTLLTNIVDEQIQNNKLKKRITILKKLNHKLNNKIHTIKKENDIIKEENDTIKKERDFIKGENKLVQKNLNKLKKLHKVYKKDPVVLGGENTNNCIFNKKNMCIILFILIIIYMYIL